MRVGYALISFDLDGTLLDTAGEIAEAANRALESHGMARQPVAEITLLIGGGLHELMRRLLAGSGADQRAALPDLLRSVDEHYTALLGTEARPYCGCKDALTTLQGAGLRLACVTNKEIRHALRLLRATQLDGYFDLVVGGDSLPEKKPHPSVLQHVSRSLGVSLLRTAHVGDSAIDVAAALNAGAAAWAVPYGYNAGMPIVQAGPDRLFDDLPAVARHVLADRLQRPASHAN